MAAHPPQSTTAAELQLSPPQSTTEKIVTTIRTSLEKDIISDAVRDEITGLHRTLQQLKVDFDYIYDELDRVSSSISQNANSEIARAQAAWSRHRMRLANLVYDTKQAVTQDLARVEEFITVFMDVDKKNIADMYLVQRHLFFRDIWYNLTPYATEKPSQVNSPEHDTLLALAIDVRNCASSVASTIDEEAQEGLMKRLQSVVQALTKITEENNISGELSKRIPSLDGARGVWRVLSSICPNAMTVAIGRADNSSQPSVETETDKIGLNAYGSGAAPIESPCDAMICFLQIMQDDAVALRRDLDSHLELLVEIPHLVDEKVRLVCQLYRKAFFALSLLDSQFSDSDD
ncbi:hypothetical protein C8Q80DRAFT_335608 [Daedaleopsis nitida]|nr:hypothetical protein C8Q80DRAFT_335608 [Daedaleopsis nitida]